MFDDNRLQCEENVKGILKQFSIEMCFCSVSVNGSWKRTMGSCIHILLLSQVYEKEGWIF